MVTRDHHCVLISLLFVVSVSKSAPTIQTSLPLKKSHSLQHADTYGKTGIDSQDRSHVLEERYVRHLWGTVKLCLYTWRHIVTRASPQGGSQWQSCFSQLNPQEDLLWSRCV
jgi:hypothetical protein